LREPEEASLDVPPRCREVVEAVGLALEDWKSELPIFLRNFFRGMGNPNGQYTKRAPESAPVRKNARQMELAAED
jgi:hypothetical protein